MIIKSIYLFESFIKQFAQRWRGYMWKKLPKLPKLPSRTIELAAWQLLDRFLASFLDSNSKVAKSIS